MLRRLEMRGINMEIEKQVCSLELSKRLKELNFEQKSIFVWEYFNENCYAVKFIPHAVVPNDHNPYELYSGFSVAELGEMLPDCCFSWKVNVDPKWLCSDDEPIVENSHRDYKEADARAKMLIYLLENKLMELPI